MRFAGLNFIARRWTWTGFGAPSKAQTPNRNFSSARGDVCVIRAGSIDFLHCKWNLSQFSTSLCNSQINKRNALFRAHIWWSAEPLMSICWRIFKKRFWLISSANKFYWFHFFPFRELFTKRSIWKTAVRLQFVDKVFALNFPFAVALAVLSHIHLHQEGLFTWQSWRICFQSISLRVMLRLRQELSQQTRNRLIKDDRWPSRVAKVPDWRAHNRTDLTLVSSALGKRFSSRSTKINSEQFWLE